MWSWLNWFYQMFIRALWTVHPLPHSLRAPALSTPLPSVCTFILQECSSNRQYHGKSPGVGVGSVAMWCVSTVQADAQFTVLKSSLYFSLCLFGDSVPCISALSPPALFSILSFDLSFGFITFNYSYPSNDSLWSIFWLSAIYFSCRVFLPELSPPCTSPSSCLSETDLPNVPVIVPLSE